MLQSLIDQLPVAIMLLRATSEATGPEADYEVMQANPAFAALAEVRPADLVGRRLSAEGGDSAAELMSFCGQALAGESGRGRAWASGGRLYRASISSPVPGHLAVTLLDARDGTEQRATPDERERLYRTLVESFPDSVHVKDAQARYVLVNNQTARYLLLRPEQVIGRTALEVYPPGIAEKIYADDMLALSTGQIVDTIDFFEDRRVYCLVRKVPIRDEAGSVVGLATIARDITELKQAEEALRASEERYRRLVEVAPVGIISFDRSGAVSEANDAVVQIFGAPSAEAARSINALTSPRSVDVGFAQDLAQALVSGKPAVSERCFTSFWGRPSYLRYHLTPTRDSENVISGALAVIEDLTESWKARQSLQASEESYRRLVEASPLATAVAVDGVFVLANESGRRLVGASSTEEMLGHSALEVVHPDDQAAFLSRMRQALSGEQVAAFETKFVRLDGEVRDVIAFPAAATYLGKPAIQVVVSDVTDRKRTEQALSISERRFRSFVENSVDGIIIADEQGEVTEWNRAQEEITGLPREAAIGRHLWDVLLATGAREHRTEEMTGRLKEVLTAVLRDGRVPSERQTLERIVERPDGVRRTVHIRSFTMRGRDGGYMLGSMVRDVTERRAAEDALRESEARFRALVQNTGEGVAITDLGGTFAFANPATHRILGVPEGDLVGRSLREFTDEGGWLLVCRHYEARRRGESGDWELSIRRRDGDRRTLLITGTPRVDETGQVTGSFAVFRDVTDKRRAEDALRHLSFHDALTQLYNRTYFEEEMRRLDDGQHYPVTIALSDVDGLKLINDTMGHKAGDDLLRAYAGVLRGCFRRGDVVARVGGDEFAVLLPSTDREASEALVKRLEEAILSYNALYPQMPISASVGLMTTYGPDLPLEVAFALADKQMYQDKLRRSASASHGVVKALLTALAAKDYVTEGHTQRVRELASRLARAVGLDTKQLSDLELLAEIHDLGKVGIPDQVLAKEGPLTDEERELLKQHSVIGYRIAKAAPELAHVAELILHHHEWWDGGGYPIGLKGEDIPLLCRILAIVDAFDAMTSDRPYRRGISRAMALRELEKGAGTQFDPSLVRQIVEMLRVVVLSLPDR